MGGRLSRRELVPQSSGGRANNPHRYPPPDGGNYFSSHFNLGYRRFPSGEPEVFLFGELNDLNFLSTRPIAFPYKQPGRSEPVRCLHSYINLQRDSVKLVKSEGSEDLYHIEFMFDSDTDCLFTVYTFLNDTAEMGTLRSGSQTGHDRCVSRPYHYSSGSEQQFVETSFTIAPGQMDEDQLTYDPENGQNNFPVAILMETDGTDDAHYQCQLTICTLEKPSDNGYTIKVLKQKLWVGGVEYLLQEIYGLENKSKGPKGAEGEEEGGGTESDDDDEELGAECVICITDVKDTMLLPCRHLCLCSGCASNLRYQSSNCPICRAPFRALLQVTALQPLDPDEIIDDDEATGNPEYAIEGYRCIPLIQALNGYTVPETSEAGDSDEEEEEEEGSKDVEEGEGKQDNQVVERTTEFCVIDIDDDISPNGVITSPPCSSPPTLVQSPPSAYEIDSECLPLPGTPTSSDPSAIQVKPSSSHASTLTATASVLESIGEGQTTGSHTAAGHDPNLSSCASSTSSQHSVKSTDALLTPSS